MGAVKVNKDSLTEQFVRQMEDRILSGEFVVGEKLPSERELCQKMGISRPVISAGLIQLEKLGLVEIRPRRGAYVCDYRRNGTAETLAVIMRNNGGTMRRQEVEALLEVRYSLESMCVTRAIQRCSDQNLEALAPFLEQIRTAASPEKIAQALYEFHHELAVLSGNMLMPMLYHSFRPECMYLWEICSRNFGRRQIYEIKRSLYDALCRRDILGAVSITQSSVRTDMEQFTLVSGE